MLCKALIALFKQPTSLVYSTEDLLVHTVLFSDSET